VGAPDRGRSGRGCLIVIGLAPTLIHLISIPMTTTSVNPLRSTAVVPFAETAALDHPWLFWAAQLWMALLSDRAVEAPPAPGLTPAE